MPAREQSVKPGQADPGEAVRMRRDHEAIAKLAASGLGEIEVREGAWKARLRMPVSADEARRGTTRVAEGHAGHGHVPARAAGGHARPEERDRHTSLEEEAAEEPGRVVARSSAVGVYQPRRDLAVGMRVRAGDRIGTVNVLGVNQDVVSPVDGIIGSSLAESGEAVEYGQELVRIELPERTAGGEAGRPEHEPVPVAGKA